MESNNSFWPEFFSDMAVVGATIVIVGIIIEGAELFVKIWRKRKYRKWVDERFCRQRRRRITWLFKYVKPRILPFEAVGFAILLIGLAIELFGSFEAERQQSKVNLALQGRIEGLRAANDKLEAAAKDRTISNVQSNFFMALTRDLPKTDIKVVIGLYD